MFMGGWGKVGRPRWVWRCGRRTERKNLSIRQRGRQAFSRVLGAQRCVASIILIRFIIKGLGLEGIEASNSRFRWVYIVHDSQTKGKAIAQGGYCYPLEPLPKCLLWKDLPNLIYCGWYSTLQGCNNCFLIKKPKVANKYWWRHDPVLTGSRNRSKLGISCLIHKETGSGGGSRLVASWQH